MLVMTVMIVVDIRFMNMGTVKFTRYAFSGNMQMNASQLQTQQADRKADD